MAAASGQAFAVEITGGPNTGKTDLLEALRDQLVSKGVDAKIVTGSKIPVASVILVDNWDSVGDGVRASVYRHPRHVVVSCVTKHPRPTATITLPPPPTDLGYILEIMRNQLRGDTVGASRKVVMHRPRLPRSRMLTQRSGIPRRSDTVLVTPHGAANRSRRVQAERRARNLRPCSGQGVEPPCGHLWRTRDALRHFRVLHYSKKRNRMILFKAGVCVDRWLLLFPSFYRVSYRAPCPIAVTYRYECG